MSIRKLTDPKAVLKALEEYDLGAEAFLKKYEFGHSRRYWLRHDGKLYDSKAIAGAAYGYQYDAPLSKEEFSGGIGNTVDVLQRLGFEIVDLASVDEAGEQPGPSSPRPRSVPRDDDPPAELDEPFRPLEINPRTVTQPSWVDPERYDRGNRAHEDIRQQLRDFLHAQGFEVRQGRKGGGLEFDLCAVRGDLRLVIEAKSLPEESPGQHAQLRLGLGQVLWYRHGASAREGREPVAVLLVEREPVDVDAWDGTCRDVDVVLTWPGRFDELVAGCEHVARGRAR